VRYEFWELPIRRKSESTDRSERNRQHRHVREPLNIILASIHNLCFPHRFIHCVIRNNPLTLAIESLVYLLLREWWHNHSSKPHAGTAETAQIFPELTRPHSSEELQRARGFERRARTRDLCVSDLAQDSLRRGGLCRELTRRAELMPWHGSVPKHYCCFCSSGPYARELNHIPEGDFCNS